MSALAALPAWLAWIVALLALTSALLALTGSIGLLRLPSFYQRVHAPTLGSTLGLYLMVAAAIICFAVLEPGHAPGIFLAGAFLTVSTPITLTLLVRAARGRDPAQGGAETKRGERAD